MKISRKKGKRIHYSPSVVSWKDFIRSGLSVRDDIAPAGGSGDTAVILFSGGTTGRTKGIMLSSLNMNALAYQTREMSGYPDISGMTMLAAMPIFHGFGLGVCVHTMLSCGGKSILVPAFNVRSYARLIVKERPDFIAGVPSLYAAMISCSVLDGHDLSFFKGVFSGGDSLPADLKRRIDGFLLDHHACIHVREGYGLTECVTASCLAPIDGEKDGSIGIPYPDTYYRICRPGTDNEVEYGMDGEICIAGPTVMKGYLGHPKESAEVLHDVDGRTWLHTGDIGSIDREGHVYFRQRLKRIIITNGYNVYPSNVEDILMHHKAIKEACVIGVDNPPKGQKVKAIIVLNDGYADDDGTMESILEHCRKHLAQYMIPSSFSVRSDLPKTRVGKIAYTVLENEENGR